MEEEFMSMQDGGSGDGDRRRTIIIVVVVLVVLCCCFVFGGYGLYWLWQNGDQLLNGTLGFFLPLA
jgi:hypothetical protein